MTLSALLLFVPVYVLAVASPGPAVAAMVARTLVNGPRGSAAFIFGLIAGDITWLLAACYGLTLVAQTYAPVFRMIQYVGAAYLLYVAVAMWRAKPVFSPAGQQGEGSTGVAAFSGAYVLTLGNPKTMIFFVSIMPLVLSPESLSGSAMLELVVVCALVLGSVFAGYVLLASRARQLLTSSRALVVVNRTTAGVMAGTAAVVASR